VSLAAVSDDADLAALDDRQVRVIVVEHLQSLCCHVNVSFFLGFSI
jgi:hypothetical protein